MRQWIVEYPVRVDRPDAYMNTQGCIRYKTVVILADGGDRFFDEKWGKPNWTGAIRLAMMILTSTSSGK
jgi:hypothetical protein